MIIAVDFDGILCKNEFPKIGSPNYGAISLVRELLDMGHEVILWTSRVGKELEDAVQWCEDRGLHFTAVNDDAPSNKEQYGKIYPTAPRKIYADIYVDDHNLGFNGREFRSDLQLVVRTLRTMKEAKDEEDDNNEE